jgi:formylglycine-generating enzyme
MNKASRRVIGVIIGLAIFTVLSIIFIAPHKKSVPVFKGHEMVYIKAGKFMMGPTESASAWIKENTGMLDWTLSSKAFPVTVSNDFYIAKHETTVAQYRAFVEDTDFETLADRGYFPVTWDRKNKIWARQPGYSWAKPDFDQDDDYPVVCLSWGDANSYCEWLTLKAQEAGIIEDGWVYRLPTEKEWEYAARAGGTSVYTWGDDPEEAQFYANVFDATPKPDGEELLFAHFDSEDGFAYTAPVGQFKPNKNGLYDIQGNVWEWCLNDYFDYPQCGTGSKFFSEKYKYKVLRGGSWDNHMGSFAVTLRRVEKSSFASNATGFRVVLAPEE